MYANFEEFETDVLAEWDRIAEMKPLWYRPNLKSPKVIAGEVDDAWLLYVNASASTLRELLLGDVTMRSDVPVLNNFGTTSGSQSAIEAGSVYVTKYRMKWIKGRKVSVRKDVRLTPQEVLVSLEQSKGSELDGLDVDKHLRAGSVLNDAGWWPFKNDAWVVGGIQGLKVFHLAMSVIPDGLLWDNNAKRPRVLGRELIGLATFGYKRVTHYTTNKKTQQPEEWEAARELIGQVFAPTSREVAEAANFKTYYDALESIKSIDELKEFALTKKVSYGSYDYSKI